MAGQAATEERANAEDRIRKTVKDLVEGVVGPGKARVNVSADLDLNRVTTQEDKYDPDGQVVRSTQTHEENSKDSKTENGGAATVGANVPGGITAPTSDNTGSQSGQTEETTNYEISHSSKTTIQEPGQVRRLSVAVAVDGVTSYDKHGKSTYTPRSADEMKRIDDLVRSAVGFTAQRGDVVTVVNVRFSHDDDAEGVSANSPLTGFDKNDVLRGAELFILLVVAALIIFFVARPLLKGAGGPSLPLLFSAATGGGPTGGGATPLLAAAAGGEQLALPGQAATEVDQRLDIAKIEGQVRVSSVKRVAEFVDKHPDESVSILRSWLHETT
jgi:flagellar M-ring protein FliF